ncbi:MAG: V-type ATP synthase subunit F [Candidatus Omnitrophica bacterium]|nr:V-type ATP synthase subunit F [Candidatus Omnitrophota bacterium]
MPDMNYSKNTLAMVGSEDVTAGFKALGFKVYVFSEDQVFKALLDEIARDKTGICLVQDDIYIKFQEDIGAFKSLPFPIFIPFSKSGKTDVLAGIVRDIRLKATGAF